MSEEDEEDEEYICAICGAEMDDDGELIDHIEEEHPNS